MKYLLTGIILFFFLSDTYAQLSVQEGSFTNPVEWSVQSKFVNDSTLVIHFLADVEEGWYMYSQETEEGGPIPLSFQFEESTDYKLVGKTIEEAEKIVDGYEEVFDMNVIKLYGDSKFTQTIQLLKPVPFIQGSFTFQICKEVCLPPNETAFAIDLKTNQSAIGETEVASLLGNSIETNTTEKMNWPDYGEPISDCDNDATAASGTTSTSNWKIFFLGILGGLVALLTPCVFPMIPLTVTFFTKRHEKKTRGVIEAILYGFCIFLIYFLLALPFLIFQLPKDTLYRISVSPFLNFAFFTIFMLFALSLFGYFEMTLPSKWANQTDKVSNKGGFLGIFFMALTLAIVSFSCTGPILGSLMAGTIATEGGQMKLVYGMSGFGVALGLPFALFAMFPGVLKKLPKSGSWMNTVKVALAFVEVALALKFLSNVDLVNQWGLIKYEVFLAIWLFIALGLAAYLFGFIRFPHDYKGQKISVSRKVIGALCLLFAGYITTGFFGSNLNALSGFPPPKHYSLFEEEGHKAVTNLDEAIAIAKEKNQPILVDFTGWTCVNCRKVEQNIWTNAEVAKKLKNDFVLLSLYADDREKLPEEQQYFSENLNKTVKTVGEKWTDFEATSFNKISQPLYAIISPEGRLMNAPIAYTSSVDDYLLFLNCGSSTYRNMTKM